MCLFWSLKFDWRLQWIALLQIRVYPSYFRYQRMWIDLIATEIVEYVNCVFCCRCSWRRSWVNSSRSWHWMTPIPLTLKRKIAKTNLFDNAMNYYRIPKSEMSLRAVEDFIPDNDGWFFWAILASSVSSVHLHVNKIKQADNLWSDDMYIMYNLYNHTQCLSVLSVLWFIMRYFIV